MKHKDYTKFSDNTENNIQNNPVITEPETPVLPEDHNDPEVITEPETPVLPEDHNDPEVITEPEDQNKPENNEDNSGTNLLAVVVNCAKLNVRKEAKKDADIECVVAKGDEVTVDLDASTEDFYKVHTVVNDVLIEGYCVKNFINIK